MSLNPLSYFERKIDVSPDLSSLTSIGEGEISPELVGLSEDAGEIIWAAAEELYLTGLHPTVSICIRRYGEVLLNRTIGHRSGNGPGDNDEPVLATPDTPMCLFSASKAVTAMLIHLLEEQGELNVLNPVSHYIPEFGANGKKHITVHQLLSHRAGISRLKNIDPEMLLESSEILKRLYGEKPSTLHGREVAYSAITNGYVLGELVQRITGKNIREFMREQIQQPLGFKYFNYGVPNQQVDDVARNYSTGLPNVFPLRQLARRALGMTFEQAVELSNEPRFLQRIIPSGNIIATADECSQFYQCLLNGGKLDGKRIFQPVTIERATQEVSRFDIDRVLMLPLRYSAGMMLGHAGVGLYGPATAQAYGHLGMTNNFCWADPEREISVAILTSGNPILGSHFPRLGKLLYAISKQCKRLVKD
ncbi:MAG: serine hydrolase [Moraxellaceae bacterium]|nr:MAG: serine hydrolase [Moraxellaceae bacterium]